MKYRKPEFFCMLPHEFADFLDSLPPEFEIVPEGHVCVKWPDGLTRDRLEFLADKIKAENVNAWESWPAQESALRALAAIAPERKKRRISLWEAGGRIHVWGEHDTALAPWRKVAGPIELDD